MTHPDVFFKRIRKKSAIFFECLLQNRQGAFEHAEKSEIVRVAGVDRAPASAGGAEEGFPVVEIDVAVSGGERVFIFRSGERVRRRRSSFAAAGTD